jgi:hypothetical protein
MTMFKIMLVSLIHQVTLEVTCLHLPFNHEIFGFHNSKNIYYGVLGHRTLPSTLKMEVICSFETLEPTYATIQSGSKYMLY